MFEEICLVCGKPLLDDGQAYCSKDCETQDAISPTMSSASSAWSSPHIQHTGGGEVPALVPSALGSALNSYKGRDRYSISSSSTSSWSAVTDDDEEEDAVVGAEDEYGYPQDPSDGRSLAHEGTLTPSRYLNLQSQKAGLQYARRPSATNTRSMLPTLHRQTSSGSGLDSAQSNSNSRDLAKSAPSAPSSAGEDDDHHVSRPGRGQHPASYRDLTGMTITARSKRSRNRASLPAYFSLLQIGSASQNSRGAIQKVSPVSSLSGKTVSHISPSTPKLALASGPGSVLETSLTASVIYAGAGDGTTRGRRRKLEVSHASSRLQQSRSRSPFREVSKTTPAAVKARDRMDSHGSVEQVFDWTTEVVPRGRPAVRRNSSPLPKMLLPGRLAGGTTVGLDGKDKGRGRIRPEELVHSSMDAPGYGEGRSGLMHRFSGVC